MKYAKFTKMTKSLLVTCSMMLDQIWHKTKFPFLQWYEIVWLAIYTKLMLPISNRSVIPLGLACYENGFKVEM